MSEFQESFNATKLIGAPAGYVGYRDSNQLADKVRAKPYSVVLFDEMEKAHPDVFNLLLQVLEDGYLMDSTGKHINFKNTVIVFTSNIGLERFNATQNLGFTVQVKNNHDREARVRQQFEEIRANILQELHNTFKVEFLNRIDKILFFEPLTLNALKEIVELNIEFLNKKLKDKTIQIELTQSATQLLAKLSFSPDEGARGVRKAIQEQIEEPLVEKILREEVKVGGRVMVEEKGKKIRLKI
jgi:ATP-dependent Clp protease ATP-binding subunit ClpC